MKKKILTISSIVIIAAAVFFISWSYIRGAQMVDEIQTISLTKSNLVDSVLASGTVISSNTQNIYSKLTTYPVKEIFVKVGDKVKAGDVLAHIDTASLEKDMQQTKLNISNAEVLLQNEKAAIKSNLKNTQNSVKLASIDLENAQRNYDKTKALSATGANSSDELRQVEMALKKAQISYDNAQITLKSSQNRSTSTARNNLEIQRLMLEKQKKNLSDAKITAPSNGTVTLANAKAGEPSAGLLFIVEDIENLIVSTSIGEYDIGLIKLGQEVVIKSDSTGDSQFIGSVSKIAPTSKRDKSGNITSSNVEFDTEIAMISNNLSIMIGMNVRLTVKLNEKKDIFAVPYDAVIEETNGSKYINVLYTSKKGRNTVDNIKKIKVETGMETDMYVEIQAAELKDGLKVLTSPPVNSKRTK